MQKRPFEELRVWQEAHDLVMMVYRVTAEFPDSERYGIISQIRRSSASVALNIVEGHARQTKKEFTRFLVIARASLAETQYLLRLSRDLNLLPQETVERVDQQTSSVSVLLNKFIKSIS